MADIATSVHRDRPPCSCRDCLLATAQTDLLEFTGYLGTGEGCMPDNWTRKELGQ